jgi:hypothetical protein
MSKNFSARFEIFGAGESSPGVWQVVGDVIDFSPDAWTVFDVAVGDCFVDENSFFGTNNRWKVTQILGVGPTAYGGGNSNSINLVAEWDDLGDPDVNGPAAGFSFLSRVSGTQRLMWEGYTAYLGGVTDGVMSKVRSINAFGKIDRFMQKSVKNGHTVKLDKNRILAWKDDGTVAYGNASVHSVSDIAGLSLEDIEMDVFGQMQKTGYIPGALTGMGALPGAPVFLSSVDGMMSLTPPTGATDSIIKIGRAEPPSGVASGSADDLHMEIEYISEP